MTELKIPRIWIDRVINWMRDLIIVFGVWAALLVRRYMIDEPMKNVVTAFLITIVVIIILLGEYYRNVDYTVRDLETELNRLKKIN